jgi:hypothetical protein
MPSISIPEEPLQTDQALLQVELPIPAAEGLRRRGLQEVGEAALPPHHVEADWVCPGSAGWFARTQGKNI